MELSDKDRSYYLNGQVAALRAFAMAVIAVHPNRAALSQEFLRLSESQIALTNPQPLPEQYLQGQESIFAKLRDYFAAIQAADPQP